MSAYVDNLVAEFNAKLAEFEKLYAYLVSNEYIAADDPELASSTSALISRANTMRGAIDGANAAIDKMFDNGQLFGLGIVPLIFAGAIVTAIAVLGIWLTDAYVETAKIGERKSLLEAGADPTTLARAAAGGFAGFGTLGLVAVAALGLWWVTQRA